MGLSSYVKNGILNYLFRNEPFNLSSNNICYLGLSFTKPNEDGTNIKEPTALSYFRVKVNIGSSYWNTAKYNTINNINEISFNEALTDWTNNVDLLEYFVIFDSLTNGNLLFFGDIVNKNGVHIFKGVPAGCTLKLKSSNIKIELI